MANDRRLEFVPVIRRALGVRFPVSILALLAVVATTSTALVYLGPWGAFVGILGGTGLIEATVLVAMLSAIPLSTRRTLELAVARAPWFAVLALIGYVGTTASIIVLGNALLATGVDGGWSVLLVSTFVGYVGAPVLLSCLICAGPLIVTHRTGVIGASVRSWRATRGSRLQAAFLAALVAIINIGLYFVLPVIGPPGYVLYVVAIGIIASTVHGAAYLELYVPGGPTQNAGA